MTSESENPENAVASSGYSVITIVVILILVTVFLLGYLYKKYAERRNREHFNAQNRLLQEEDNYRMPINNEENSIPYEDSERIRGNISEVFANYLKEVNEHAEEKKEKFVEIMENTLALEFKKRYSEFGEHMCSICMEEFKEGEMLRKVICGHNFHNECIIDWIGTKIRNDENATCPLCTFRLDHNQPETPFH